MSKRLPITVEWMEKRGATICTAPLGNQYGLFPLMSTEDGTHEMFLRVHPWDESYLPYELGGDTCIVEFYDNEECGSINIGYATSRTAVNDFINRSTRFLIGCAAMSPHDSVSPPLIPFYRLKTTAEAANK